MDQSFLRVISSPLILLHAVNTDEIPLVCVPGAGASVTAFVDLIGALGERWPVYGLQPRGMDLAEPPHKTVEEAALYNLRALAQLEPTRAIHLLGHSHGGLVVFEMAMRLQEQRRHVASVTLIDTEPPGLLEGGGGDIDATSIFREFIEVLEQNFDRPLNIDDAAISVGDTHIFICVLHALLVKEKLLSPRSTAGVLRGPLDTFIAVRRTIYMPTKHYPGRVHLALVSAYGLNKPYERDERATYARKWRSRVAELDVWYGPGNHASILQLPHAKSLAEWWRKSREP